MKTEFYFDDESIYEKEKRLVKRLDYVYVMPLLSLLSIIQFFDKSALNYSALLGIKEDTSLSTAQFGWLGSVFYLGILLFQLPNAYVMQRIPLAKYLSFVIIIWGLVLALTSLSKNFIHLAICRFLLGVFEAGVFPATNILISRLYRRSEQSTRIGIVYIFSSMGISTGGIISYGIGHMKNVSNMKAWQWMMIILGCITVVFGMICLGMLKDDAKTITRSATEEAIVEDRIRDNAVVVTFAFNSEHIKEALTEARFYCYMGFSFLISLQSGAFTVFSSVVTKGFGFSDLNAILLGIPTGFINSMFILLALFLYHWLPGSSYHVLASIFLFISTIGHLLLIVIPLSQAKLLGLYLCYAFLAAVVLVNTSITNNVSGYTKKIFYNGCVVIFATLGSFTGPLLMRESPYLTGLITYMAANCVCIILLLFARWKMAKKNFERRKCFSHPRNIELDITDGQDVDFKYRL